MLILMTATTRQLPDPLVPRDVTMRTLGPADAAELGALYVRSYLPDVIEGMSEPQAIADMIATFDGRYGRLVPDATQAVIAGNRIVAVVMTVTEAPFADTPPGPFIIEVFTDPTHRRQGFARAAILTAMRAVTPRPISLRVDAENRSALLLYRSLGFVG